MIQTIRVSAKSDLDPPGQDLLAEVRRTLGIDAPAGQAGPAGLVGLSGIRTVRVFRLEGATETEASRLAELLLAESIDQNWSLNRPLVTTADRLVEVAYKPGVMNPEAASILKAAQDLGIPLQAADASWEYAFYGNLSDAALAKILTRLVVNPTIQRVVDAEPHTLLVAGAPGRTQRVALREMDDARLMALSDAGLHLTLAELHAIRDYFGGLEGGVDDHMDGGVDDRVDDGVDDRTDGGFDDRIAGGVEGGLDAGLKDGPVGVTKIESGRDPTDLELEVLAQTWSEHCAHKTFKSPLIVDGQPKPALMRRLKEASALFSDLVVSAFVDNSGVMRFYDGWAVAGKVETHNSPSAIEPYGGAMTGSGGVFRDVLGTGQGAAVVASTDVFCFAPPDLPAHEVPPGALPPDYLLRRVVAGVRDYGNRMGIPTNNGSVHFHPDFRAKPTVIVGAYGLLPEVRALKGTPQPGDRILVLGGRTGRDGIHGATFSSTAMSAQTISVNATAVQIGNAVEERRVLDALLACRDAGLIRAVTDCGAGGFSSAIGEMAEPIGADVHLDRAPLKYEGLAPWEIFLSESQERMVLAVAPEHASTVAAICRTYNVEATDLGSFEPTGRLLVRYHDEVVGDLALEFLHDGRPETYLEAEVVARGSQADAIATGAERTDGSMLRGQANSVLPTTEAPGLPPLPPTEAPGLPPLPTTEAAWRTLALAVMASPNVASKEPIVRQYDHTVQGMSALASFGGPWGIAVSDAAVLAPLYGQPYGLVIAHGLNPVLMRLDPYWGSVWAAAEAMANLVAVGGNPREACLIDNFIWPVPTPAMLGALDRAVDACVDVMHALERPFISGKDSLSSTYRYPDGRVLEIPPVLCVSVFGRIPDVLRTVSSDFKAAGSTLVLVGARDVEGMGGSIYLDVAGSGSEAGRMRMGRPPEVDLGQLPKVLDAVHRAIISGHVRACHDVSEGGLLVTLAEMAMGGGIGADVNLDGLFDALSGRPDASLFNETAGVFVVGVADEAAADELFGGVPHVVIGRTVDDEVLRVVWDGQVLFGVELVELRDAWEGAMRGVFH